MSKSHLCKEQRKYFFRHKKGEYFFPKRIRYIFLVLIYISSDIHKYEEKIIFTLILLQFNSCFRNAEKVQQKLGCTTNFRVEYSRLMVKFTLSAGPNMV
jgi:hypothetical protein